MPLSSTSIIHLTPQKHLLLKILKEGFKPKYCFEKVQSKRTHEILESAFPLVSFSDLPLSELKIHISAYGSYGIGLTKNWAKLNGLNPVLYFEEESLLINDLIDEFNKIKKYYDFKGNSQIAYNLLMKILAYSKNYEGKLITEKRRIENYRFSDEREWRYTPTLEELEAASAEPFIELPKYKKNKDFYNGRLNACRLKFKPNDIKYIIIKNESEANDTIDYINAELNIGDANLRHTLISRIITADQILNDI